MVACPFKSIIVAGTEYKVSSNTVFVKPAKGGKKVPVKWKVGETEELLRDKITAAIGSCSSGMQPLQPMIYPATLHSVPAHEFLPQENAPVHLFCATR